MTRPQRNIAAVAGMCNLLAAVGMAMLAKGTPIVGDVAERLAFIHKNPMAWRLGWSLFLPTAIAIVMFYRMLAGALPATHRTAGRLAWMLAAAAAVGDAASLMLMIVSAPRADAATLPQIERAYELSAGLGVNLGYTIAGIVLTVCCLQTDAIPRRLAWLGCAVWPFALALSVGAALGAPMVTAAAAAGTLGGFSIWCFAISRAA